jgi:hypothetical protein
VEVPEDSEGFSYEEELLNLFGVETMWDRLKSTA